MLHGDYSGHVPSARCPHEQVEQSLKFYYLEGVGS